MVRKVQTQLLVTPVMKERADALSLVREEPRAEVYRIALEGGGLSALERAAAAELQALEAEAAAAGITRAELVERRLAEREKSVEYRRMAHRRPDAVKA